MTAASLSRTVPSALSDHQVYRLLFAATFLVFLVAVVIRRIGRILGAPPAGPAKSILAEARETGSSTLLFAFMG